MGSNPKSRNFDSMKRRNTKLKETSQFETYELTDSPYEFFSPTLDPSAKLEKIPQENDLRKITLTENKRYDQTLSYIWNKNYFIRSAENPYIELLMNHATLLPY